jgi:DNA-binding transcriptional regulator YiaG
VAKKAGVDTMNLNADNKNYGNANNGDCIRSARIAFGFTQKQFANIIGVRQATVADWENKRVVPSRLAQLALINFGLNGPKL